MTPEVASAFSALLSVVVTALAAWTAWIAYQLSLKSTLETIRPEPDLELVPTGRVTSGPKDSGAMDIRQLRNVGTGPANLVKVSVREDRPGAFMVPVLVPFLAPGDQWRFPSGLWPRVYYHLRYGSVESAHVSILRFSLLIECDDNLGNKHVIEYRFQAYSGVPQDQGFIRSHSEVVPRVLRLSRTHTIRTVAQQAWEARDLI
jgi:hypothetical protein